MEPDEWLNKHHHRASVAPRQDTGPLEQHRPFNTSSWLHSECERTGPANERGKKQEGGQAVGQVEEEEEGVCGHSSWPIPALKS